MDKSTEIAQAELIHVEKLEIWRRRLRVMLPDTSELKIRNEAYRVVFEAESEHIAKSVYDTHFHYLLAALSLPLQAVPNALLECLDSVEISSLGACLDLIAEKIHSALKQHIIALPSPSGEASMWQEDYEKFSGAVEALAQLDVSDIRHRILSEPVGLALSGGGIRSASFNLGVIESLNKEGITDQFDYLSTVSGGGYIGTAWSVNSIRQQSRFPFEPKTDKRDDEKIRWLRAHGSYLTRGREINTIAFVASIFKGIFINALVWLPPWLLVIWFMVPGKFAWHETYGTIGTEVYLDALPFWMLLAFAFFSLSFLQTGKQRNIRSNYAVPPLLGLLMVTLPALLVALLLYREPPIWLKGVDIYDYAYVWVAGVFALLSLGRAAGYFLGGLPRVSVRARFLFLEFTSWFLVGGVALVFTQPVMQLKLSPVGGFVFFAGLILAAKLTVNMLFMALLSASSWTLHEKDQRMFAVQFGDLMMLSLVLLVMGGLPVLYQGVELLLKTLQKGMGGEETFWQALIGCVTSVVGLVTTVLGWVGRGKEGADAQSGTVAYLLRTGVTLLVAVFLMVTYGWVKYFFADSGELSWIEMASIGCAVFAWSALVLFSDINKISMHFYYRNRLADAFLSNPSYNEIIEELQSKQVQAKSEAEAYLCGFDRHTATAIIDKHVRKGRNSIDLHSILDMANDPVYQRILDHFEISVADDKTSGLSRAAALCGFNYAVADGVLENVDNVLANQQEKPTPSDRAAKFEKAILKVIGDANLSALGAEFEGVLPMAVADIGRSGAPYHIINSNLVLVGSHDPELKARYGDNFVFTPRAIGARTVQWSATTSATGNKLRRFKPHGKMTYPTAMAVSGAAVDPNVGATLSAPLRIVMTLLNVRLGYWRVSPRVINKEPEQPNDYERFKLNMKRLLPESWLILIAREMFGLTHENGDYVRLSDGGHFENLGVYELIRRRCSLIVVSDAGADPRYQFGDLAKAILLARADFGVNIKLDYADLVMNRELDAKRKRPAQSPVVEGVIEYPELNGEPAFHGRIILIKTNLFEGLDSPDVLAYAASHGAFPDETTADQFFDECQFEAYRQLGKRSGLLAAMLIRRTSPLITVLNIQMERVYRRFQDLV